MKILHRSLFAGLLLHLPLTVPAQATHEIPLTAEARQFDFWVGEWEVFGPDGQVGGHSRIERIAEGHALLENWTDSDGSTGKSLNVYNAQKKQWQQFWVGSTTPVLELSGGFQNGAMVLSGSRVTAQGATMIDRITWTPRPDGTVRQLWEVSHDSGKTWQTSFDGIYQHKK